MTVDRKALGEYSDRRENIPPMNKGALELKERRAQRVLILRPDNLGDVVLFSGALRHLRQKYADAEITLCVKRYVRNLLELCPYVDKLISWEELNGPLSRWSSQAESWASSNVPGRRLLRRIKRKGDILLFIAPSPAEFWARRFLARRDYVPDAVLLPVRSPTPEFHRIVRAIPARRKYGIAGDFSCQPSQVDRRAGSAYTARFSVSKLSRQTHELAVTCGFLRFLGIAVTVEDVVPEFWTDESDRRWAVQNIPATDEVILGLCPGVVSLPGKSYGIANYAAMFSELSHIRFAVVLFGSVSEKPICEEVAKVLRGCGNVVSVINLSGRSSIRQLVEGIRRCAAVVSGETASLHIAVALGKPTVGIMGGGHYGRFYPWGEPAINRVACKVMDCYWCDWQCVYPTVRCIQEISGKTVATELRIALSNSGVSVT